jgi:AsmA-like C-terminal region
MSPNRSWKDRKVLRWLVLGCALALIAIVATSFLLLRPERLKAQAERKLSEHLGLAVTIGELEVSLVPRPQISGRDLVGRLPSDQADTPFLRIDRFSANIGPFSVWRGHVAALQVDGIQITVPPRGVAVAEDEPEADPAVNGPISNRRQHIVVDQLEARHGTLTVLRREPGKEPLVFEIHQLSVSDVGFDRVMSFSTDLTNPVPEGRVQSKGTFGPWNREHPTELPITGDYSFTLANLDTIRGIGGMLTSTGHYQGHLTRIAVAGQSSTPDFSLDMGGRPVPLTTTFRAIVDGSDGSTVLEQVDAKLFNTSISTRGRIDNLPGPGRRNIDLTANVTKGRIEDLLRLVVDAKTPALTGDVSVKAHIRLPPGKTKIRDRLKLDGAFTMARGEFSDVGVSTKLLELSRRSQGKAKDDESVSRALSTLAGRFALDAGVMHLSDLTFQVPGALVALDGTYGLESSALDLSGTLRMDATVSRAVGGIKSIFLKPFDFIFRKDGAGAVLPIEISGTYKNPDIGISIKRALGGGKKKATSRVPVPDLDKPVR